MSAGAKAVCGKALGLSPKAAEELKALADHLGEDLELAKRLHEKGLDVALCEAPAVVPLDEMPSLVPAVERFTRWMQVLRSHRPGLYPTVPLLFTPTWPLALLSALLGSPLLAAATGTLVLTRTLLAWRLAVLSTPLPPGEGRGEGAEAPRLNPSQPPLPLGEGRGEGSPTATVHTWLLGEALLLTAFARSLWNRRTVTWRGRTYELLPGGRMLPVRVERTAVRQDVNPHPSPLPEGEGASTGSTHVSLAESGGRG